jgi:hypothetical protein
MRASFFAAALTILLAPLCAQAASQVVATDQDTGKTITVAVGTPLVVKLTGHHGSGYYWRLDADLTPELILSGRETSALAVPGSPETTTFTFTTAAPGMLQFKASNLKAGAPIPTGPSDVSFTVVVTP